MDTLTLLLQILGAIIEGAKLVVVVVAFVLLSLFCRYIPLKLRKLLPQLAATALIMSIAEANCEQYCLFVALCCNRLATALFLLYGSVSMMLIFFAIVLVKAIADCKVQSGYSDFLPKKFEEERGVKGDGAGMLSNSYLSMTPVLLS